MKPLVVIDISKQIQRIKEISSLDDVKEYLIETLKQEAINRAQYMSVGVKIITGY